MKKAIKFSASWCHPCKIYAEPWDKVKSEIGDWEFNEVDVDSDNPLTMDFSIKAVPTTILLVNDKIVHRQSGVISAVELRNLLQKPY
jgi:thioredoxin 1